MHRITERCKFHPPLLNLVILNIDPLLVVELEGYRALVSEEIKVPPFKKVTPFTYCFYYGRRPLSYDVVVLDIEFHWSSTLIEYR